MKGCVSIIIPVFNNQEALNKALVSISEQSYKSLEIIVVDDGSSPSITVSNTDVKLLKQANLGAPVARNKGLESSTGEFVVFWDRDVVADRTMLEKMVKKLQRERGLSFAYCNMSYGKNKMPAQKFSVKKLKENNYIHSTSLIRKSDAVKWDESLKRFQDWDLWLMMAEQGKKGVWVDEYLFTVTPHKKRTSTWLPSFAYKKPWRWLPWVSSKVKSYEVARNIVAKKHQLSI
jgi:glycosyltransferase involved in cell wall biosynthesis